MFFKKKKRIIQLETLLQAEKERLLNTETHLHQLLGANGKQRMKIEEYKNSLLNLNQELDRWEPLSNRIAEIKLGIEFETITLPEKGLKLLENYESEKGK